ncbi:MAG: DUF3365 domain-containing protein [Alphaproteobacteria bacterium]|nr:DUF3365 domain-containing protein [Alphaproteobacteria bacterium]
MTFTRHISRNPKHFVTRRCRSAAAAAALLVVLGCASFAGLGGTAHAAVSNEDVALSLATLLRSARAVISKNQKLINDETKGDKGLTSAVVLAKAKENYKKVTGVDIDSIDSTSLQGELLKAEMDAIVEVMDEAQPRINEKGVGLKGFLPAIFARLVTQSFRAKKGDVADIKLTAPKNYVRNRANRPDKWENKVIEEQFKAPDHKKGQHVAAMADKKGKPAFRLILPEYYKQSCLACHGEPKGERDITGGKKEGGQLGELGGAISVTIFQ